MDFLQKAKFRHSATNWYMAYFRQSMALCGGGVVWASVEDITIKAYQEIVYNFLLTQKEKQHIDYFSRLFEEKQGDVV